MLRPLPTKTELIAITGASGFIGGALVASLLRQGLRVRTLLRSPAQRTQVGGAEIVVGSIDDAMALERLVDGASAVVHVAGLVSAARRRDFFRVNAVGTARLLDVMLAASPKPRVLFVSSLAARAPDVSAYAASKYAAESHLKKHQRDLEYVVVRPPAVYGPGDRATLPLLRLISRRLALVPGSPACRFSLLYVDDLVALLTGLLQQPKWQGTVIEPDDGRVGGYTWRDLTEIIGDCLGKPIRCLFLPQPLLLGAARFFEVAARLFDQSPILSYGKVREFYYTQWISEWRRSTEVANWEPKVPFRQGFQQAWQWYHSAGWL